MSATTLNMQTHRQEIVLIRRAILNDRFMAFQEKPYDIFTGASEPPGSGPVLYSPLHTTIQMEQGGRKMPGSENSCLTTGKSYPKKQLAVCKSPKDQLPS